MAVVAMPVATIVACGNEKAVDASINKGTQINLKPLDQSELNKTLPYTPASLQADAKKIGSRDVVWRGSLAQEADQQAINTLAQLAKGFGYDFDVNFASENNQVIITDAFAESMVGKSDQEVIDAFNTQLSKIDSQNITELSSDDAFDVIRLSRITIDTAPITDEMKKTTLRLSPGNQTIDGIGDFKDSHITSSELNDYSIRHSDDATKNGGIFRNVT